MRSARAAVGRLREKRRQRHLPLLEGDQTKGGPDESPVTLAVVCNEGFGIDAPNANSTLRMGFARGFAEIGIRYELIDYRLVEHRLPALHRPIVFLSAYDFPSLSRAAITELGKNPHFVWVNPWFAAMDDFYATHDLENPDLPQNVKRQVLDSGPSFVWTIAAPSCLHLFEQWEAHGVRVESIPLACDSATYFPDKSDDRFSEVQMAFVGGYWANKAIQFDKYLRPYEDILRVFGRDEWPYKGYGGRLSFAEERMLYSWARVCPALSEPHAEKTGDIVERAFKVMGCRGLALPDVTPFYRDLFGPSELAVPDSVTEYHELVHAALDDEDFNEQQRAAGYKAVMERHTYAHRARQVVELLGLGSPVLDQKG